MTIIIIANLVLLSIFILLLQQDSYAQQEPNNNIDINCESLSFSKLNLVPVPGYTNEVQLLGKITNNSTQTLEGVTIVSEFYDNKGELVDVRDITPSFYSLDPGETSPFKIVTNAAGNITNAIGNITLSCGTVVP